MRKSLVLSAAAVAVTVALVTVGGALASFSDTETSNGNSVSSAGFDLDIGYRGGGNCDYGTTTPPSPGQPEIHGDTNVVMTLTDQIQPGDELVPGSNTDLGAMWGGLCFKNSGDVAGTIDYEVVLSEADTICDEPESEAGGCALPYLDDVLTVSHFHWNLDCRDGQSQPIYVVPDGTTLRSAFETFQSKSWMTSPITLQPNGNPMCLTFWLHWDSGAPAEDNKAMSDEFSFDIAFTLTSEV